jgi:hypothetical protein
MPRTTIPRTMPRSHSQWLRNAFVLGLAAIFLTTAAGCFGRFRAMNAVYDFNKSASPSTVVRSLLLFAMLVIPVYFIAFLADWIVLNTIDFLNGTGTVADRALPDGSEVHMAKLDADTVRVRHVDPTGKETSFDIVRVGPDAGYLRGSDGRIVGSVERLSDGRLLQQAR